MLTGATIIDTALQNRRGKILSADGEKLLVTVMWKPGQFTNLAVKDIQSGRYQVLVDTMKGNVK